MWNVSHILFGRGGKTLSMLSRPSSWPSYVAVVLCRESIWREKVAMITEEPPVRASDYWA